MMSSAAGPLVGTEAIKMMVTIVPTLAQRVRMEELQRTFPKLLWMDIVDEGLSRYEMLEAMDKEARGQ